jgi:ABC-type Na+ efflux pump permease subunit
MRKLLVIAHREYAAMVATKAFLFTLVMMPILMFGGMFLMPKLSKLSGGKTQKIVIADGTGQLFQGLQAASTARNAWLKK